MLEWVFEHPRLIDADFDWDLHVLLACLALMVELVDMQHHQKQLLPLDQVLHMDVSCLPAHQTHSACARV